MPSDDSTLERRAARERAARKEAERLLEQKSAELWNVNRSLVEAHANLEQRIEERTQALTQALATATANEAARTRFLAGFTHELRTPLTSILGYTSDLLEDSPHSPDLQAVQRNANHLLHLINEILDFAQVESTELTVERKPVRLRTFLDELGSTFEPRAERKNLRFRWSVDDAVPAVVLVDALKVRQVLINFIGNALKFTDGGTIAMRVFVPTGERSLLRFDVLDTGRGIPPDALERVFEAFQQTEGADREVGTGLGLAICKRLADAMEGKVSAQSTVGRGSCFSLEIPGLQLDHSDQATPVARFVEPDLGGLTVLLAEDSRDSRVLLKRWLERAGATVLEAEDGVQAVNASSGADLVLMDMQMPRLGGLDATRQLRAGGYAKPVLALTALTQPERLQECLNAGCTMALTKPISKPDLLTAVWESWAR
jgi:signal transduction histidine kinase